MRTLIKIGANEVSQHTHHVRKLKTLIMTISAERCPLVIGFTQSSPQKLVMRCPHLTVQLDGPTCRDPPTHNYKFINHKTYTLNSLEQHAAITTEAKKMQSRHQVLLTVTYCYRPGLFRNNAAFEKSLDVFLLRLLNGEVCCWVAVTFRLGNGGPSEGLQL